MDKQNGSEEGSNWEFVDNNGPQIDEDQSPFSIESASEGSQEEDNQEKPNENPVAMIFSKSSIDGNAPPTTNDRASIEPVIAEDATLRQKIPKCMSCCAVM